MTASETRLDDARRELLWALYKQARVRAYACVSIERAARVLRGVRDAKQRVLAAKEAQSTTVNDSAAYLVAIDAQGRGFASAPDADCATKHAPGYARQLRFDGTWLVRVDAPRYRADVAIATAREALVAAGYDVPPEPEAGR